MKRTGIILGMLLLQCFQHQAFAQDKLLKILKTELQQQMQELQSEEFPPYHLNYRVEDRQLTYIAASFGAIMANSTQHQRHLITQVRVGSPEFDNFRDRDMGAIEGRGGVAATPLAIDDEGSEDAIRQAIWFETCNRYRFAVDFYQQAQAQHSVRVDNEDQAPCFSPSQVTTYYEAPLDAEKIAVDKENGLKKSGRFQMCSIRTRKS